jgi:hypothetical protein
MSEPGGFSVLPGAIGYVGSDRLLGLAMKAEAAQLSVVGVKLEDRAQTGGAMVARPAPDELEKSVIGAIRSKDRARLTHLMTGPARTYAVKWVELSDKSSNRRLRVDRTGQIHAAGGTHAASGLVDRITGIAT